MIHASMGPSSPLESRGVTFRGHCNAAVTSLSLVGFSERRISKASMVNRIEESNLQHSWLPKFATSWLWLVIG